MQERRDSITRACLKNVITCKMFGKGWWVESHIHRRPLYPRPVNYDISCKTIHRSADCIFLWNLKNMAPRMWVQPLVIFTIEKYKRLFIMWASVSLNKPKSWQSAPVVSDTISKCKQFSCCDVFDTWVASYCDGILSDFSHALSIDAFIIIIIIFILIIMIHYIFAVDICNVTGIV